MQTSEASCCGSRGTVWEQLCEDVNSHTPTEPFTALTLLSVGNMKQKCYMFCIWSNILNVSPLFFVSLRV